MLLGYFWTDTIAEWGLYSLLLMSTRMVGWAKSSDKVWTVPKLIFSRARVVGRNVSVVAATCGWRRKVKKEERACRLGTWGSTAPRWCTDCRTSSRRTHEQTGRRCWSDDSSRRPCRTGRGNTCDREVASTGISCRCAVQSNNDVWPWWPPDTTRHAEYVSAIVVS